MAIELTDGEKMIFAAAYVDAMGRLTRDAVEIAARIATPFGDDPEGVLGVGVYAQGPWGSPGLPYATAREWIFYTAINAAESRVVEARNAAEVHAAWNETHGDTEQSDRALLAQIFGIAPPSP